MNIDLGRLSSNVLTEVRTVLSRTETAIGYIESCPHLVLESAKPVYTQEHPKQFIGYTEAVTMKHPDVEEMLAVLIFTRDKLKKWEKTGKAKYREGELS